MNFRPITAITVLVGGAIASCYPVEDPRIQQGQQGQQPQQTLTEDEQRMKMLEEQRLRLAEEELRKQQQNLDGTTDPNTDPTRPPTTDYPFANKVPGKEGFVFSPYNKQVVDVRDIPSGTLVQDPTYPASEKKYFRVP